MIFSFDFICVPKERQVHFSRITASPYQNEEIIYFGIPIIFEILTQYAEYIYM